MPSKPVWVVLQMVVDDCSPASGHNVYGVYGSQAIAEAAVKAAPKAKSIVDGYDYRVVIANLIEEPPITKDTHRCKHIEPGAVCQEHNLHCAWPKCAIPRTR